MKHIEQWQRCLIEPKEPRRVGKPFTPREAESPEDAVIQAASYPYGGWCLTIDCETTTDYTHQLRFGYALLTGISADAKMALARAGTLSRKQLDTPSSVWTFYNPDTVADAELATLQEWAAARRLPAPIPVRTFITGVFYPLAYEWRAMVIGHNLPFDLSALARTWGTINQGAMDGGFWLHLCDCAPKTGGEPYRSCFTHPDMRVKHIGFGKQLIDFCHPGGYWDQAQWDAYVTSHTARDRKKIDLVDNAISRLEDALEALPMYKAPPTSVERMQRELAEWQEKQRQPEYIKAQRYAKGFADYAGRVQEKRYLRAIGEATDDDGYDAYHRGKFLDTMTLGRALLGPGTVSLAGLGRRAGARIIKREWPGDHAVTLTPDYLEYGYRDVWATWALYQSLREHYAQHRLNKPIFRIFSEASIGKAYLDEIGVPRFLDAHPEVSKDDIGTAMQTYYGGRTEVRTRLVPTRVAYADFRSEYPTVTNLMQIQRLLLCEHIETQDATDWLQQWLPTVTMDTLLAPETWPLLTCLVRVKPAGDILPVRTELTQGEMNIGLCHVHGPETWYTLADVLSSYLLTGKRATITKALRFVATGPQRETRVWKLFGQDDFTVDLNRDDFFTRIIDQRLKVEQRKRKAEVRLARRRKTGILRQFYFIPWQRELIEDGLMPAAKHTSDWWAEHDSGDHTAAWFEYMELDDYTEQGIDMHLTQEYQEYIQWLSMYNRTEQDKSVGFVEWRRLQDHEALFDEAVRNGDFDEYLPIEAALPIVLQPYARHLAAMTKNPLYAARDWCTSVGIAQPDGETDSPGEATLDRPTINVDYLDSLQRVLKLLANSTAYGVLLEVDTDEPKSEPQEVRVWDDGEHVAYTKTVEHPGSHFAGCIGTFIPAAGRLFLAMAERMARDAGLGYVLCDTDSMAFSKPDAMDGDQFLADVAAICERFIPLSPYEGKPALLRLEDVNDWDGHPEPLYALAVSSKRYVMYNKLPDDTYRIRKFSSHGTGAWKRPDAYVGHPDVPPPCATDANGQPDSYPLGGPRWMYDLWYDAISQAEQGIFPIKTASGWAGTHGTWIEDATAEYGRRFVPSRGVPGGLHEWFSDPARLQVTVTTPGLYQQFESKLPGIRPYSFIVCRPAMTETEALVRWTAEFAPIAMILPDMALVQEYHTITGVTLYESPEGLRRIQNHELVSDNVRTKTMMECFAGYFNHREGKFANGNERGWMERHTVAVVAHIFIGKESNQVLDDVAEEDEGMIFAPWQPHCYGRSGMAVAVASHGARDVAAASGLPVSTLYDIANGAVPRPGSRRAIVDALTTLPEAVGCCSETRQSQDVAMDAMRAKWAALAETPAGKAKAAAALAAKMAKADARVAKKAARAAARSEAKAEATAADGERDGESIRSGGRGCADAPGKDDVTTSPVPARSRSR